MRDYKIKQIHIRASNAMVDRLKRNTETRSQSAVIEDGIFLYDCIMKFKKEELSAGALLGLIDYTMNTELYKNYNLNKDLSQILMDMLDGTKELTGDDVVWGDL